jgi:hypothetical protein
LERTGLLNSIWKSVIFINRGRKWLDIKGQTEKGRVSYRKGLAQAMVAFKEVQALIPGDLELPLVAEYTFINQELDLCESSDVKTLNSLNQAVEDFDRAFLVVEVIQKPAHYRALEKGFSLHKFFRYEKMPKDSFHVACLGHIARLNNILRSPGINPAEKALLEQRLVNIKAVQKVDN